MRDDVSHRRSVEQPSIITINAVLLTLHQLNTISIQDLHQMKIQYYSFHEDVGLLQEDYVYIMSNDLLLWLQQHLLAVHHQQRLLSEIRRKMMGYQALNVAAILLTGSACSVLLCKPEIAFSFAVSLHW